MSSNYSESFRASMWQSLRHQAESFAGSMCVGSSSIATDLIMSIARRYCNLPAPTTEEEMGLRTRQGIFASSMIVGVSHADAMAKMTPKAAPAIYDVARRIADRPFPQTNETLSKGFVDLVNESGKISSLCLSN